MCLGQSRLASLFDFKGGTYDAILIAAGFHKRGNFGLKRQLSGTNKLYRPSTVDISVPLERRRITVGVYGVLSLLRY